MRFAVAAAAIVGAASASYGYGEYPVNTTTPAYTPTPVPSDVYTTKVVTELTTYCPSATEITHGGKTYTVTSETTLTITDCPCTVIETPSYTPAPPAETSVVPPYSSAPAPSSIPPVPYPTANGTTVVPVYPTGTAPPTTSSSTPAEFPGAASQAGVGLLAVVGALAAFL